MSRDVAAAPVDDDNPPVEHEHVHKWMAGDRSFRHAHPMKPPPPEMAARRHLHANGGHSHPHRHEGYGA